MEFQSLKFNLYLNLQQRTKSFDFLKIYSLSFFIFFQSLHWDLTWINQLTRLVVCILEAVFTVSPKKQYLGTLMPTTPATAGPEWIPSGKWNTLVCNCVHSLIILSGEKKQFVFDRKTNLISWRQKKETMKKKKKKNKKKEETKEIRTEYITEHRLSKNRISYYHIFYVTTVSKNV